MTYSRTSLGGQAVQKSANLSDLTNAATARINLGAAPDMAEVSRTTADSTAANLLFRTTRYDTSGGAITQTLPAATAGAWFAIGWDGGTAALTYTAAGSDVIGSGSTTSASLSVVGELRTFHCATAGRWREISKVLPSAAYATPVYATSRAVALSLIFGG